MQTIVGQTPLQGVENEYGWVRRIYNDNTGDRDSVVVYGASEKFGKSGMLDVVLFMTMKGAYVVTDDGSPEYGKIPTLSYMIDAGLYSFMLVDTIVNDSLVIFSAPLRETNLGNDSVPQTSQLISVPDAPHFELSGDLLAAPWTDTTGGVVAVFAHNRFDLNGFNIDASGKGFRGGDTSRTSTLPVQCAGSDYTYYFDGADTLGGRKGESMVFTGFEFTRGSGTSGPGAGGGEGKYAGGGGGGSYGDGGQGGGQATDCPPPPGLSSGGYGGWNNTNRIDNIDNRAFMGSGGGGALPHDGLKATPGGRGGGIVIILTDTLAGINDSIIASGQSVGGLSETGAGGGGGGGMIILDYNTGEGQIYMDARGGKGGDASNADGAGPGGGGGGGVVWHAWNDLRGSFGVNIDRGVSGQELPSTGNVGTNGIPGAQIPNLIPPLRGFSFNFIVGRQDVCQDSIPALIRGSIPKGDTAFSFIWQDSISGGSWQDRPEDTLRNLQLDTLTITTSYRRIVIPETFPDQKDTSQFVTVTVFPRIRNNNIVSNDTVCFGLAPDVLLDVPGLSGGDTTGTYAYQYFWQQRAQGSTDWVTAAGPDPNSKDYQSPSLTDTTYFRRQVISHVCSDTNNELEVIVLPLISGNQLTGDDRVCQFFPPGDTLKGGSLAGGDGEYRWEWEAKTQASGWNTVASTEYFWPDTMKGVTTRYRRWTYSGKDSTCTDLSDTVTIRVDPELKGNSIWPVDTTICAETPNYKIRQKEGINLQGGDGVYHFAWEKSIDPVPLTWIPTGAGDTLSYYLPAGLRQTHWYRRILRSGACVDTTEFLSHYKVDTVIINNTIASGDLICEGTRPDTIIGATPGGGNRVSYYYAWDRRPDGQTDWDTTVSNAQLAFQPAALFDTTWFRRRIRSGVCWSVSDSVKVEVQADITGNEIEVQSPSCEQQQTLLGQAEGTSISGGDGIYEYRWWRKSGASWLEQSVKTDDPDFLTDSLESGAYEYLRYVSSGECQDTSLLLALTVHPRPSGGIAGDPATNACYDPVAGPVRVDVPLQLQGVPPFTLNYSEYANTVRRRMTELFPSTQGSFPLNLISDDSTHYVIELDSIQDANQCWAYTDSISAIGVNAVIAKLPQPAFTEPYVTACDSFLTITAQQDIGRGSWGPASSDYEIADPDAAQTTIALKGWTNDTIVHTLRWKEENAGCPAVDTALVISFYQPVPRADAGNDDTIYFADEIMLWATATPVGVGTWDTLIGTAVIEASEINLPNALLRFDQTLDLSDPNTEDINVLKWVITNGAGCPVSEDELTIVRVDIPVYSAFTPNNDGWNDELILDGIQHAQQFTLRIYSRFGVVVRTVTQETQINSTNLDVVWDGKMENGDDAEDGTYLYTLEIKHNGRTYAKKNYLELVRSNPNQ